MLAIKADQRLSGISSHEDLRLNLAFPDSVERVAERLTEMGVVVVLIDQIDALSLSMARDQRALNVVLDLVARLRLIPGVRILVSCRVFDLNNDPSLKQQFGAKKRFSIPELSDGEVTEILEIVGVEYGSLTPVTRLLLKTPLHLDLFALAEESQNGQAADQAGSQGLFSLQDLYALLWRNIIRKSAVGVPPIQLRERVTGLITDYMDREQRTSAPQSILNSVGDTGLDDAAYWLASEGILVPAINEWTYLHQTFFDYCYAKTFVERGNSLTETVLLGDQGLFARPQIVQVLGYLRGASSQNYLRELNRLLTEDRLRVHLRDLVINWFGALPAPTEEEWLLARQMLIDQARMRRLIGAVGGNPSWFGYLKESTLPGLLERDDETLNTLVVPYLISMLGSAQAEVVNMVMPFLGRSEVWNQRLIWMLQNIREWKTPEAIDLFERVFESMTSTMIRHLYQLDEVAKADARTGCRLVRMAFDKVLEDYLAGRREDEDAYLFSLSTFLEQYNGSTMDEALKVVTQEEPEYFLEMMLPWLERVIELTPEQVDQIPFYSPDELSFLGWYGDGFVVKHQLIEAYINALTALARTDTEKFRATAEQLASSSRTTPQRLLAHVYRAVPDTYASEDMIELLEGYVRDPAGEDEDWWKRQDESGRARPHDGLNSGPYMSYLNSDRGAAFRALMRSLDIKGDEEARSHKWEMIEFVATDASTALRAGAIEELLYIFVEDRERAITIFQRLMDQHPALLRSHFTQEFLRYGLYRYYERMRPYIINLMNSDNERCNSMALS